MSDKYKIEFFDRDFNFIDWSMIDRPPISFDYLTLESTSVTVPKTTDVPFGSFIHITNGKNIVYQGIVKTTAMTENITTIAADPLLALLDVQVYYDRTLFGAGSFSSHLKSIIESVYVVTDDANQKIDGLSVTDRTVTGAILPIVTEDNIHNFWDLAVEGLKMLGITISAVFMPGTKSMEIIISEPAKTKGIDINLPTLSDVVVNLPDPYGSLNKVIFVNKDNESQQSVFTTTDYIPPAVWTYEYLSLSDGEIWAEKCAARAAELFSEEYSSLIEFTAPLGDPFVGEIGIGDTVKIYDMGQYIPSVLTGWEISGNKKRYTFGLLRIDYTKNEVIERRKNK